MWPEFGTQDVPRAPDLQIAEGVLKAGASQVILDRH